MTTNRIRRTVLAICMILTAAGVGAATVTSSLVLEERAPATFETAQQVLDSIFACTVPSTEATTTADVTPMMLPPGECALDFDCAAACQATSHACSMACPGYPYDIPWWQACLQQCRDEEAVCAQGCCL